MPPCGFKLYSILLGLEANFWSSFLYILCINVDYYLHWQDDKSPELCGHCQRQILRTLSNVGTIFFYNPNDFSLTKSIKVENISSFEKEL